MNSLCPAADKCTCFWESSSKLEVSLIAAVCLCRKPSAKQVSVVKHAKPSLQQAPEDQNTPASIHSAVRGSSLSSRNLLHTRPTPAAASHRDTDRNISPAGHPANHANAQEAVHPPHQTVSGLRRSRGAPDLLQAVQLRTNASPFALEGGQEIGSQDPDQRLARVVGPDSSRQPFQVLQPEGTELKPTSGQSKATAASPGASAQQEDQEQALVQGSIPSEQRLVSQARAQHYSEAQQPTSAISVSEPCSSSGSFSRLGSGQDASHVSHMRPPPVSSGSVDTAASSSTNAAAHLAATSSAAVAEASVGDFRRRQRTTTVTDNSSSPTMSRAAAASASEGRTGQWGDAPGKDSGASSKPSRARAGTGKAGRQSKSKGPSTEASLHLSFWRCLPTVKLLSSRFSPCL